MTRSWSAGVHREVLPNGLALVVQVDPSAPAVALVQHVRAGFFDEPDEVAGISHVLEHMFFKGTPTRGPGAIARETKAAGGYLNASTSYDRTSYFAVLPRAGLGAALAVQADALMHAALDADELRRELQVIIQEAKRKLDTPSAVCHETLHEVLFDRHRIRRWRIGTEAGLAALTRGQLWDYYRSRYVPARTVVAIVGDLDLEATLALARATYGAWEPAPAGLPAGPAEPPHADVRVRTLRGDVAQAELAVGWRGVPALHPDSAALDLAAAVLASGRGSWLYRALRETGLVTGVNASNHQPSEVGVFSVGADLPAAHVPEAIGAIAEAVHRLALLGPRDEDLERARTLLLARWARGMESMEGRASSLAWAEAMGGVHLLDEEYAALERTPGDAVRAAAERHLRPDAVGVVAYLPRDAGDDLDAAAVAEAFGVTAIRSVTPVGARPPVVRPAAPRRAEAVTAGVLHVPLPGADLLVRRKPGVPLVTLGVHALRGAPERTDEAGLAALAMRTAVRGAAGRSAAELAFACERLGGTLGASAGGDWVSLGTTVLADRVAEAAALVAEVMEAATLADEGIEAERALLVQEAKQVADDMFRFPFQLAFAAAFGDAGYGVPAGGTAASLARLGSDAVRRWYAGAFATRPAVVAVGDAEPEALAALLAPVFERLPAVGAVPPAVAEAPRLGAGPVERVAARDKAQTALAMVFAGPGRRDPLRWAAEVWSAVASGLGGRLFEALRDKRSLAYTVVASAWQRRRAGALVTYIATSPERETEARDELLRELARFATETVTDAELRQAQAYLAGQAEVARQSAGAVAAEIVDAWFAGDGLAELADPGAPYRAVTADEVRAVAAASLDPGARAEGVVRGTGGGR